MNGNDDPVLISRDDALKAIIENSAQDIDRDLDGKFVSAMAKYVEVAGRQEFFQLRNHWSTALLVWISILIIFNCALTICVGFNLFKFQNLDWFVTSITVETFLQTVGLGYVAARYLFSNQA